MSVKAADAPRANFIMLFSVTDRFCNEDTTPKRFVVFVNGSNDDHLLEHDALTFTSYKTWSTKR